MGYPLHHRGYGVTVPPRPCLTNGPDCPGDCYGPFATPDSQARYHAHLGFHPDECRTCGKQHPGPVNDLCEPCLDRIEAESRVSRMRRTRFAELSNPHLEIAKLDAGERFRLEYEEVA